ncbi:MAG: hypothetical protein IJ012_00400 [Clostridia bacterium]|nr:hypothetical protein [Clostridia bacterium]
MLSLIPALLSAAALAAFLLATEPTGYALFLLAAITLHETGHLTAFLLCGERLPAFRGRGFGFLLTPQGSLLSYKKELAIAAAGPLFNLAACVCLLPALRAGQAQDATFCFFALNFLTAAFNLLPIRGFDGGRILSAALLLFLPPRVGETVAGVVSLTLALLFYFCALFLSFAAGGGVYPFALACFLLWGEASRYPSLFEDFQGFGRKSKHFREKRKFPPRHSV